MAITCPRCGSQFDATLFQFGHGVRCRCGADVEYPGTDLRTGHVATQGEHDAISHEDRCVGCLLGTACGDILGAAVEGSSAREIRELYGEIRDFAEPGRGFGCYTAAQSLTRGAKKVAARGSDRSGPWRACHAIGRQKRFQGPWRAREMLLRVRLPSLTETGGWSWPTGAGSIPGCRASNRQDSTPGGKIQ